MLERARKRREALKSRLKEVTAVTGRKRNVESTDNNENLGEHDSGDSSVDEGKCILTHGRTELSDKMSAVNRLMVHIRMLIVKVYFCCWFLVFRNCIFDCTIMSNCLCHS